MRITAHLFIILSCVMLLRVVHAKKPFPKKKNRTISNTKKVVFPFLKLLHDREAYPQPLPTDPPKKMEPSPYRTLYQGVRYDDDKRVFRKRFEYEAMLTGQQIVCQGLFDCIISHIAIESTEAIPVLLRGGAGYRHFTAIVKSRPNHDLKGQVRAYCRNKHQSKEATRTQGNLPRRRFYFKELNKTNDSDDSR